MGRVNVVFIPDLKHHSAKDFLRIAEIIRQSTSCVIPHVITSKYSWWKKWWWACRPCLFIGLKKFKRIKLLRGELMHGHGYTKHQQYRKIKEAGLPVLQWCEVREGTELDPADWGEYVVLKPEGGKRGRGVKITKTRKVRWKDEMQEGERVVAQQFAYTGELPVSYRVLTFLGEPLYCMKSVNISCGNKLERVESSKDFAGHNIVATARQGEVQLVNDSEVMDFAREVAGAFKEIPVLGIDVVRDIRSSELYCVEVNPYGQTWHFSSELGEMVQEAMGQRFEDQFEAFKVVSDVVVKKAHLLAK